MKKILILIVCTLIIAGCNNDFMERFPQTSIAPENFFNSEADLQMYIYGLYNFGGLGMCTDDNYNTTDDAITTGVSEIKTMMLGNPTSQTITSGWSWSELRNINFFLDNFQKAALGENTMKHYEGIARLFRARFYYNKVLRYNDVPWIEHMLGTNSDELYGKQDPRTVIVDKIMDDFDFASKYINPSGSAGEITCWVAKTLYARAALYEGSYRKYHSELSLQSSANDYFRIAADVSMEIIKDGGFSIYNTGNPASDYRTLFVSPDLTRNSEVILPTIYDYDIRSNGFWAYMFGDYETCPTKNIVQSYLMADGSYYSLQAGYQTFSLLKEFENRDPRMSQTLAAPGWELAFTSNYSQGEGLYTPRLAKAFTGYHQIKGFMNTKDNVANGNIDWPTIRYAEVLLTYAEAQAERGELTGTDLEISVNQLRYRAGMPAMPLNPAVDPVLAARYPQIASNGQLLEIRRERQIEYACEGYRFWDLMRWGCGKLLEKPAKGIYFPGLGSYDMNGDGVVDIKLIGIGDIIPNPKEKNDLGKELIYYRVGDFGETVDVYLENGASGCVEHTASMGTFLEPKYYYRPVPYTQTTLNKELYQQFEWK